MIERSLGEGEKSAERSLKEKSVSFEEAMGISSRSTKAMGSLTLS
jgi:hypothetical protein